MNPLPVRPFVPLEALVAPTTLQSVEKFALDNYVHTSTIRGIELSWLCLSRRLLWMAVGQEYIEPELLDWIDAMHPSSVLYDIGASNGIFAMYAAARGADVFAFEPDPSNYFLLSYNNYLNSSRGKTGIKACMNFAISSKMEIGMINIRNMELGSHEKILDNSVDVFGNAFSPAHTHAVLKCRIDDLKCILKSKDPTHIKIDVDGSEIEVLRGANQVLKSAKSIFIELTDMASGQAAHSLLSEKGFHLVSKHQVQNYEGLHNCIYEKD